MEWSIFAQVCHLLLTTAHHFGLAASLPSSGSVSGGLSFQPSLEGDLTRLQPQLHALLLADRQRKIRQPEKS